MGNVSIIKKFWKKFLNVNFDDFGLTISSNSERIMRELGIPKGSGKASTLRERRTACGSLPRSLRSVN